MKTFENEIKEALNLPNYNKTVFNIDFCDHAQSDGTWWINLNTGNELNDLETLERIQAYLMPITNKVLRIELFWDDNKYDGSQLLLQLK